MSDWNTFYKAYQNANETVRKIIDSDAISTFLDELIEKRMLDRSRKGELVTLVGDIVLSITSVNDVPDILAQMGIADEAASRLTLEIKRFVETPYSYIEEHAHGDMGGGVGDSQAVPVPTPLSSRPQAQPEPEPEAPEGTVQPLRTMEEDIDKIHGYGSYRKLYPDGEESDDGAANAPTSDPEVVQATSQEDTLKQRPSLAGTPSYRENPNAKKEDA